MRVFILVSGDVLEPCASRASAHERAVELGLTTDYAILERDLYWHEADGGMAVSIAVGVVLELADLPDAPLVKVEAYDVPGGFLTFSVA